MYYCMLLLLFRTATREPNAALNGHFKLTKWIQEKYLSFGLLKLRLIQIIIIKEVWVGKRLITITIKIKYTSSELKFNHATNIPLKFKY